MPVTQLITSVGRGYRPFPTYYTINNAQQFSWNTVPDPYPFDGSSYAFTGSLGSLPTTISINMWFRPRFNNVILLAEQDSPVENTDFHYTMVEINAFNVLQARIWDGVGTTYITPGNNVNLDQWNHLYYEFANGTLSVTLNNGTAQTGSIGRTAPTNSYIGVGTFQTTYMITQNRFQGELGALDIASTQIGSNYLATKSEYGL